MAYFPNGTAGLSYQGYFCSRCKNWIDKDDGRGVGCAIWDLHLMYSHELCNSKSKAKKILDFLIPMNKEKCCPCECSMFLPLRDFEQKTLLEIKQDLRKGNYTADAKGEEDE